MQKSSQNGLLGGFAKRLRDTSAIISLRFAHLGAVGALPLALCLTMDPGPSFAADFTWDRIPAPSVQGGNGDWNTSNNKWTTNGGATNISWLDFSTAIFGGASGTVTLEEVIKVGGITFNSSGYVIDRDGSNALDVGAATIGIRVANAGQTATIEAPITGTGGVNVNGAGILVLTGANTYTGLTTVFAGSTLTTTGALKGPVRNNSGVVNAGGTITGDVLNTGTGAFNATGALTISGTLTNKSANPAGVAIDLNESLSATSIVNEIGTTIVNAGTLSATNPILNAGTLTNTGSVNAAVSNTGTLNSSGMLTGLLLNSGIVNAAGTINGNVGNSGLGTINTTGALTINGLLLNSSASTSGVSIGAGESLLATNITNNAGSFIVNAGTLSSTNQITNAGTLTNTGAVTGGVNNSGTLQTSGPVSGGITNSGTVNAAGAILGTVANNGTGTINTIGNLSISGTLTNSSSNAAGVSVQATESLSAINITNNAGAFIVNAGALSSLNQIDNIGTITNTGTMTAAVKNSGTLNTSNALTGAVDNSGVVNAAGTITGAVGNTGTGAINTTGALTITGTLTNSSSNSAGVSIEAAESLSATSITNNSGSFIVNQGTLSSTNPIDNHGRLSSTGIVNAAINNTGTIDTANEINGNLSNSGVVNASGKITGAVGNTGTGAINTTGALTIAGTLTNSSSNMAGVSIEATESLSATSITNDTGSFIVNAGTLSSTNPIDNHGRLSNTGIVNAAINNTGTLDTSNEITGTLSNSGVVNASGKITGGVGNTGSGAINTTGALTISGTLTNSSSNIAGVSIEAAESLSAANITNSSGAFIVNAGLLTSTNSALANSGALTNTGTVSGGLAVNAGQVQNLAGGIIQGGTTVNGGSVASAGALTGSVVVAGGSLTVQGAGSSVLDDAGILTVNSGTLFVASTETIGGLAGLGGHVNIAGGQALIVKPTGAQTFAGALANSGIFTVDGGGGTLTLTGDSSAFSGTTTVNGATLSVGATGSLAGDVLVGIFSPLGAAGSLDVDGVIAGNVTAVSGGSVGGSGGTLGGLVINGGAASAGASLNIAGTTSLNAGTMAAVLNGRNAVGQDTGMFDMTGGLFTGTVNNFQSFVQTGGELAAGSTINSFGFAATGGTNAGAAINAQLRVTAVGGVVDPLSAPQTVVSNANGDVDVEAGIGLTLGGAGTTAIQTSASGATKIVLNGPIRGARGIDATGIGALSSVNVETFGTIETVSTAIRLTSGAGGGPAIANILNNIEVSSGDAALVGSGNATFNVEDGVLLNADNVLDSVSGLSTLNNRGTINGAFQSGSGSVLIQNFLGGVLNLGDPAGSSFGGAGDRFVNEGVLTAFGAMALGGLEQFTNAATGTVDISNGAGGDNLTIGGNMANEAGARIFMDVDLSNPTSASQNDVITVLGNLTSDGGAFVLENIASTPSIVDFPELVLIKAGSVDPGARFTVTGLENLGLFSYQALTSGSNIVLRSLLDAQAAGGIVSNFITAQNSVSNAFFKPASGFVSSPLDPAPNQLGFSPWFRASGGLTNQGSSGVAFLANGPQAVESSVKVGFGGYQFGLDGGIFNIAGSGASVHLGLTAGQIVGSATQEGYNNETTMKDTFVGAYGIYSNGPFFLDAQLRQEFIEYTVNVDDRGFVINDAQDSSQRFSGGVSGGYVFNAGKFSVIPAAGYTFARTTTDNLDFAAGSATASVEFEDAVSHLAFAGISASTSFLLFDDQLRVSPFVSATAYHDFADDQGARLVVSSPTPATIDVTSGSGKTYGEVSLGANFLTLTPEIAGTQRLLSGNVRGDVQFGEDRLGGSLNAQIRLQF